MSRVLARTTEVVVPTVTGGVAASAAVATVVVEAAARVVAGSGDIRQLGDSTSYRQLHKPLLTHSSQIGGSVTDLIKGRHHKYLRGQLITRNDCG